MPETKPTDKIDLARIVKMFDLPDEEAIWESNWEYLAEARSIARKEADEDATEEEIEKAENEAENAAQEEIWGNYHNAVTSAADQLFEVHDLELVPVRKGERYPFEFRIQPVSGKTWKDAARKLAATINGVGLTYEDPSEYGRAPRQYVLSRLGWVSSYPEVYGSSSASSIYERSWR